MKNDAGHGQEAQRLAVLTSDLFYRHDTGPTHPETAQRLDAVMAGVMRVASPGQIIRNPSAHPDTGRIIAKVHSPEYQRQLEEACRGGMRFFHSLDNPISSASHTAARLAVSTALEAADRIWSRNDLRRAFVVARPPGHHAERSSAMGFCFFNTIACVAEWLRERPGIERVFIFDFDVHHGNGTQHLFEERDDVFYASMHRWPFYPGTGAREEIGIGRGRGFTRNIPLNQGDGDLPFLRALEKEIVALIDDYHPDAILLSAGFDAHQRDPLGGLKVTEGAFGDLTRTIVEAADRHCGGRVLSLLEGGYDMEALASSSGEHVRALL